VLHKRHK